VEITLEEAYQGTRRLLEADGSRLQVKIPPGVKTGSRVRVAGRGGRGAGGGPAGDVFLRIKVLPHGIFERKGDDLACEVPVELYTALLGGEVRVPTLTGAVKLKIPPETQPGRSFRLRGRGMPVLRDAERHGDLFARVKVTLPQQLSEREMELFRELAKLRRSTVGEKSGKVA
jgi:DnaJ-class molecular chaperone